jgi:inhibitor of cysteine peptidase
MRGDIVGTTVTNGDRRGAPPAGAFRSILLTLAAAAGLATLAAGAGLAACGGDAGSGSAVYTEADNGRTVTAAVGDSITIRLSENASTGYSWTLRQSSGLSLLVDDLEQPTASPGLVGAPGVRVFTLEVTATGTQMVQAAYERPWEAGTVEPAGEFTLTIAVE